MRTLLLCLLVLGFVASAGAKPYLRKPKHGIQMRTAPYTVGPGEDREWCEYRRVELKKPMDVSGFKVRMPPGAHHFVVWGYGGTVQDDSKFPSKPVESIGCVGVGPGEIAPRVIIPLQTPNARFKMPKGIAIRLEPNEQIYLNSHLRNNTDQAVTPDIRANFYAAKPGSVKHLAEGLIFGNMAGIDIPAGGDQTITAEWTTPVTINIVFLAGHQHRLGTRSSIDLVDANGNPQQIYENFSWEHPANLWPQTPIRLEKGAKMRITCTWHNTDDHVVRFGPNTTDEMCFALGFYYRDDGDTEPVGFGQCLPATSGMLCPLAPLVK